ncbi:dihydrolipoyllysine-residue succinyltransferase component of 2-oxoglutarate dehydrogenase complex [Polymorphobacter glacialis]|uniref:Dihydrolipoyllysine-residue succinyltransferase component of 2-oxoglutarate dehydrogenase complex n=1 Tax=Sandarakinorhabdus glacialis TaxID=1614636 RepID=A0A916ZMP4_9SPHN|nr:2-oxoglutarate dehydrogenase complex dihydrolipoyllysine-residue succinyltransferase [Polymorphobacter glacialis]GGE05165.1 dihydrolipoyllysine-residue succinyltransferase component of 2-oxoglutarate dehydrogenase complex [Polymorphobacter glacialis]
MATDVIIPALGESITEATVGQWLKQPGEAVAADEPIVSLETDKVAVEVPSPVAGTMGAQLFKVGDTVAVGARLATIEAANAGGAAVKVEKSGTEAAAAAAAPTPVAAAEKAAEAAAPASAPAPAATPQAAAPAAGVSAPLDAMGPAVRTLIDTYNLDVASIPATGRDGRLTKGDVLAAIEAGTAKVKASAAVAAAPAASERREERVRMTRLRQTIARRLKEAQNTAAMLTTFNDVDMTAVMAARVKYKDLFEKKHGVRLGFMSFFSQAVVLALRDVPAVGASLEGEEIVYRNYADLGIAVSSPGGLVVPVLRNADKLSFAQTEKAIGDFGKRAQAGKLTIDELQGGNFTISNGGVFGSLMSTPILNTPQSGVLGLHRIEDRPVARDGQVVIRPMMYLALSYDHRIVDGREAVTFLVRVKEAIEDPARLLIDL